MAGPAYHGRTHLLGGTDPIPGVLLPPAVGSDVADLILALPGLSAFWKLNETSGTIAADSSGNGHDLEALGSAPTWGEPAGPPGETSAGFTADAQRLTLPVGEPMASFTNNFTAGVWFNQTITPPLVGHLLGQGVPYHGPAGTGWGLYTLGGKIAYFVSGDSHVANASIVDDTWYFVALVRDSGTWKLYINGLLQADTSTTAPDGTPTDTWIGGDAWPAEADNTPSGLMSYAFITDDVLTSTELLAMLDAAETGGVLSSGLVWTADGAGGADWAQVDGADVVFTPAGTIASDTVQTAIEELATDAAADVAALNSHVSDTAAAHDAGAIAFTPTGSLASTDVQAAIAEAAAEAGGNPASDASAWMPLTTVVGGTPELVWDASDSLIPTLTPL